MLLPRSKQARNKICAPHRAQNAAASTITAADTRTLRRRYYKTPDGCKGGPSSRLATLTCYAVTGWTCAQHAPQRGEAAMGCRRINYRYYNPTDGRWTRRDPISIEGGIHLYGYIRNRSPYLSDYRGLYVSAGNFSPHKGYQGGDKVSTIHAKPFGGSSSVFLCAQGNIDAKTVIKISYPEDNEEVLRHESTHAFIALGLWADFISAVEPYDYTYFCACSSCFKNFQRYVSAAVKYYNVLIYRDNLLFDVEDYPRRNISQYHIEKTKERLIEAENLVKESEREFMNLKQTMKEKCQ